MMGNNPQLSRNKYDKIAVCLEAVHKRLSKLIQDYANDAISPNQTKSLVKANKIVSRVHFELDNTALMAYGMKYKQEHRVGNLK